MRWTRSTDHDRPAGRPAESASSRPASRTWRSTPRSGDGGQAAQPLPEEAGDRVRDGHRVKRVGHHRIGPRPRREPAVLRPADEDEHRWALVDLVLDLAADTHPAGWRRLTVEHGHVDVTHIEAG